MRSPRHAPNDDVHVTRARAVSVVHEAQGLVGELRGTARDPVPRVDARRVRRASRPAGDTCVVRCRRRQRRGRTIEHGWGIGPLARSPPSPASDHDHGGRLRSRRRPRSGPVADVSGERHVVRPRYRTPALALMAQERVADLSLEVVHRCFLPDAGAKSSPSPSRRADSTLRPSSEGPRRPAARSGPRSTAGRPRRVGVAGGRGSLATSRPAPHDLLPRVTGTGNVASRARDERSTFSRRSLDVWRLTIVRRRYASNASGCRRYRNRPATCTNASWTRSRAVSESPLRKYARRRAPGACRT